MYAARRTSHRLQARVECITHTIGHGHNPIVLGHKIACQTIYVVAPASMQPEHGEDDLRPYIIMRPQTIEFLCASLPAEGP